MFQDNIHTYFREVYMKVGLENYSELYDKGVYLDNAATSFPKPDCVWEAMRAYMQENGATSSRGAYKKAIEADRMVYEARKAIAQLFNCQRPSNVVFSLNITESLNLVLQGILRQGDHVITSSLEHNGVRRCLKTLERDRKIEITTIPCSSEGITDAENVRKAIKKNTKLIVFIHASNVVGTIQPIREIGKIAEEYDIPFLVDTAQTAGVYPIDIVEDHISLLAFTGHKGLLGPTGTGGLVINWQGDIRPLKSGGTGGDSDYPFQPDYLPNKFEAGTPNVAGIVGLGASVQYLLKETVEKIREEEKEIIQYAIEKIREIKGISLYGPQNAGLVTGAVSFNVQGVRPEEVGFWLNEECNIAVRTGLHCAPGIHDVIGTTGMGTVRIGIGYRTTKEEIDYLTEALSLFVKEKLCF